MIVTTMVLLVLSGCSSPPERDIAEPVPVGPTPSARRTIVVQPVAVPPGIHLSFVQQRIDEGTARAQVRVINGTPRTLHVRSVGVDWPGYPLRLHRVDYDVFGAQTVDLRYLLPRAVCTPAAAAAPIVGVAVTDRGVLRRRMGDDGVRFLTRLRETACDARRLDAAVTLSYADTWRTAVRDGRLELRGSLVLTRPRAGADDRSVRVTQVEGSVLFDLSLVGGAARSTLDVGRRHVAVPVVVRDGGRCDPHSRGQSTQTFLFRAFLRVDGGPEVSRLVSPTGAQQVRLLRFLDHACAEIS